MSKKIENDDANIVEEYKNKTTQAKEYYIKSTNKANVFSLPLQLVYLTLPYKETNKLSWQREISNFKLSIDSGIHEGKPYGIPYGTFARKLMYLTCTEAVKNKLKPFI